MPSLSSCTIGDSIWYGHKLIPQCLPQNGESKRITTWSTFRQWNQYCWRIIIINLEKDKIKMSTANKGIKWHFNAPLGPHMGGIFETMIKAAKWAVSNIIGNADWVIPCQMDQNFKGWDMTHLRFWWNFPRWKVYMR